MEEGSDEEEMPIQRKAPNPPQQPPPPPGPPPPSDHLPPLPPTPDQVIIRKNYDPKGKDTPHDISCRERKLHVCY